jgi:hypothetical protein
LGVNGYENVFTGGMSHHAVRIVPGTHIVDSDQANFFGDGFLEEAFHRVAVEMLHDASDDIAVALDCPDNLARTSTAGTALRLSRCLLLSFSPA